MKLSKEVRKISKGLFQASIVDGQVNADKVRGFMQQIVAGKPRGYVAILKNYHRLLRLETEKRHVIIESAVDLNHDTAERVLNDLKAKYGPGLTTEFRINPSLLAGLRIRVGSDVWDGSIRARLDRLDQELAAA